MPNTLTVSSKQSPFPYAAITIAAYTGKAKLIFDDSITDPVLVVDGTPLTFEEDIVQALAKAGGLSSDSEKVICEFNGVVCTHLNLSDVLVFRTLENTTFRYRFPRHRVCSRFS
jgi:hypothetical protein